jgi:Calcineurin-like phosphoesterase
MKFDIIGDVHGQYYKLFGLLRHLGYELYQDTWKHPGRTAIFVGDLIDRGPDQVQTVELVRRMEAISAARCILGNHEFNAIAWATPDPDRPGKFLRDHDKPGNCERHEAFLVEVEGTPKHQDILRWFNSLPMWLDYGDFRVVHACWHQASIDKLQSICGHHQRLSEELIVLGSRKGH